MYRSGTRTILSPSDLVTHLGCEHATERERRVLLGELTAPEQHDPDLDVLRRRGAEHELAELARFRAAGLTVGEVTTTGSSPEALAAAEAETLALMQAGVDVVFQATFFDGRWRGHADFLVRTDAPSDLGPWSYDVADTKLARRAKPAALVQLCAYAEHVARLQGTWPRQLIVITGDGEHHRHRTSDVVSYFRMVKARFEATIDGPLDAVDAVPVSHCEVCAWAPACEEEWRAADHLSLIAGVRSGAVAKLAAAGITTGALLAGSADGAPVDGMELDLLDRLRRQARLQLSQRADGVVRHELLLPDPPSVPVPPVHERSGDQPPEPRPPRGLAALPEPSPGDLFFDIEGDPWEGEHGIEYLFGVVGAPDPDGSPPPFTGFWGHDEAGERAAFEALVDLVVERLDHHPDMHVYHYAPYERTVLQRLAGRYDTRQAEVDRILRGQVLVDLYQVVRHAVLVSQDGYGLKKLEPLYLAPRTGEAITDGSSSIVVYEEWLETGDPQLLEDIRAYNEIDCRSTLGLRDWLEARREELALLTGEPVPRPEPAEGAASTAVAEADEEHAAAVEALLADVPLDHAARSVDGCARQLLADLLGWHRREERPGWWSWYERLEKTDQELVSDREAIGGLLPLGPVDPEGEPRVHRYAFDPEQDHKLPLGKEVADPRTGRSAGTLVRLDAAGGTLDLDRPARAEAPHPTALIPPRPIATKPLRQALLALAEHVVANGLDHDGPWRAACGLLRRDLPRLRGAGSAHLQAAHEDVGDALVRLAGQLDGSTLAVQGPPGSGKTRSGADAVVALVAAGRRVGITAHSHAAITNLLEAVCKRAAAAGHPLRAVQKCDADQVCRSPSVDLAKTNADVVAALASGEVDVVAGTPWLFAREDLRGELDVLVVDEAGQLSLANTLAVSGAATDLVLLGDPQQLAQPSKGTHPDGAEASGLDHVLDGAATIDPERGLFLDRSFRMHPDICRFVSTVSYDDRLHPAAGCERRAVGDSSVIGGAGLRWVPVEHAGNRTRSAEEADVVATLVDGLLGREVTDVTGATSVLRPEGVLVIAPYNAQVAALHDVVTPGVRVGTVDRFQGQQAPVVLYSLTASSAADIRRGIGFLLSTHRLNVAVSRAQALVAVVGSPALLRAPVRSADQLRQVNALCRFVEQATEVRVPPSVAPVA
ncbi:MAG: TM0106 family RecB-like putative nuclease [Acidimicrobiales bacterium]